MKKADLGAVFRIGALAAVGVLVPVALLFAAAFVMRRKALPDRA